MTSVHFKVSDAQMACHVSFELNPLHNYITYEPRKSELYSYIFNNEHQL